MDADDLEPRQRPKQRRDLTPMSVDELETYIADMEAEIARVREAIEAKKRHRAGIEGLFKQ
jgi:uncharacterized small protein (DUF1192 family)